MDDRKERTPPLKAEGGRREVPRGVPTGPSLGANHPPLELLAALIDGRLESDRRASLIAHLNSCPDCYLVFADTLRLVDETETTAEDSKKASRSARQ